MSGVCRCPAGILTSVRGTKVTCRYPDQCQGFEGTLQISWPVSGVCRCPADILTSVRGLQVPCRYLDQCQRFAGTLQVSWPVSEVCRYPAGILTSVRGLQVPCRYLDRCQRFAEISLLSFWLSRDIGRLSVCTHTPHREGNSMEGPPWDPKPTRVLRKTNSLS